MSARVEEVWEQALACCNPNLGFSAAVADIRCDFYSSCEWTLSLLGQLLNHHAIDRQARHRYAHKIAIIDGNPPHSPFMKGGSHKVASWSGKLTDDTPVLLTKLQEREFLMQVGAEVRIVTNGAEGHTICSITESPVDHTVSRRPQPDGYFLPLLQLLLSAYRIYVLHASAIALQEQAMLLVGPSGAGKTTMSLALARAGMEFMGDDLIAVARQDGEMVVHALLFHPKIEAVPGKGKEVVDCITAENLNVCHTARISSIISLQRNSETGQEFVNVSRIQVLQWLLAQGNDLRLLWYPWDWFEAAAAIADVVPGYIWNLPPPEDVDISLVKKILYSQKS